MALGASDLNIIIKATDQASATMKGVAKEAGGLGGALGGVAKIAGGIAVAGIAAAGVAVVGLGSALFDCTQAAMEAELVQASLAAVIKSTGGAAGIAGAEALGMANATSITIQAANDLATALSQVTMFDDEMVISAEAVLLRFQSIGTDTFPTATKAALDLATVMGTDAATAATTLGKALETPGEGLLRLKAAGVAFSTEETKMLEDMVKAGQGAEAQAIILDRLNESIGGAAEAAGATAQGQWTIFSNQMQNIKENIGAALLPALTTLGSTLTEALQKPEVQAAISSLVTALGDLATKALPPLIDFLTTTAIPAMITLAGILSGDVSPAATGVGTAFSGVVAFIQPVIDALGPLMAALGQLEAVISPILIPALQALADIFTNVILPVMGAQFMNMLSTVIGMFTGFLTFLTGAVEMIVGLFTGDMDKARGGAQKVMEGILGIFRAMVNGILTSVTNIANLVIGAFEQLGIDIVAPVQTVIDAVLNAFNTLPDAMIQIGKDLIDGLSQGISDAAQSVVDAATGVVDDVIGGVTDVLGIESPSKVFAEIGTNIMLGLVQGIQATRAAVSSTVKATVNDTFKEWWGAIKSNLGASGGSNIRRMFQDWMRDWLATATVGISETTGDLVERMLADAAAQFGPGVASILQQFAGSWQSILGSAGGLSAGGTAFGVVDAIMGMAGRLGGIGNTAADRYNRQVIDPLREELRILEEQGGDLEQIAAFKDQIAKEEAKILALQQQQADLQWLNAQLDLIKLIKENGLNAANILGGLTFGINANPGAILDAMTAAMAEMLQQAQSTFSGFGVAIADAIPEWLVPGSPTAFELGLRGIGRAMDALALPSLSPAYADGGYGGSVQIVYSPIFSAVDAHEAEYKLKPLIEAAVRKVMR